MSGKSVAQRLREHRFLEGASAEFVQAIAGCTTEVQFMPDTYLFREGEPATGMFLLQEGRVALEVRGRGGPPVVLQTLHGGDVAGWSWLVPPGRWQFDGRAASLVRALHVDARCLQEGVGRDPWLLVELYRRILPVILGRLQATRLQILDVYGKG